MKKGSAVAFEKTAVQLSRYSMESATDRLHDSCSSLVRHRV